jgi:hypothetical protein
LPLARRLALVGESGSATVSALTHAFAQNADISGSAMPEGRDLL